MSGGTGRTCATCGLARHCPDYPHGYADVAVRPCWRPRPAPQEPKPVAGCEYCRPSEALYKAHHGAELHLSTLAGRRTLQSRFYTLTMTGEETTNAARCAEFYINFCPNCGRDLRGD